MPKSHLQYPISSIALHVVFFVCPVFVTAHHDSASTKAGIPQSPRLKATRSAHTQDDVYTQSHLLYCEEQGAFGVPREGNEQNPRNDAVLVSSFSDAEGCTEAYFGMK